jgi:CTP synthase
MKGSFVTHVQKLVQQVKARDSKIIVITGGVCSSIGKGVLVASIGVLLKNAGYSVSVMKLDPYLNVDPGTMSPLVHGEVFVTADGAETDLDLGHYERHLDVNLSRESSVSSGQIYQEVLDGEREGRFLGKCIQVVPHVVNVGKERILNFVLNQNVDFVLMEIGGTVGDIEGEVFLEAIRQLRMELGGKHFLHGHLGYVPFLSWTGEIKTKPTQHSVMALKHAGLVPDCLFLRADKAVDQQSVAKLSIMCEIAQGMIFQVLSFDPIYELFTSLDDQGLVFKIQEHFKIVHPRAASLDAWKQYIQRIKISTETIRIGLVAKYVGSNDPYISVIDALKAAGYYTHKKLELVTIEAEMLEHPEKKETYENAFKQLKSVKGIVVPGGFDKRGAEGKIVAARFAREHKIPYLGLCLGMQIIIIEAARALLGLDKANSLEFDEATCDPVITIMQQQKEITKKGATMRLGSYPCKLMLGSKAQKAYGKETVTERHRHRYEVNNSYRERLQAAGLVFSGLNAELGLVEITEIKDHPFMVGSQFHPEFTSRPLSVNPLFQAFMEACK